MSELSNIISIANLSKELGFLDYGVSKAGIIGENDFPFSKYIAEGANASMDYLSKNVEKRKDPSLLVEGAESILCFLAPYSSKGAAVASFALGEDYHKVIKDKLYIVLEQLKAESSIAGVNDFKGRVFVDSAPIKERYWAARAGLGFIGKNHFLISPDFGLRTLIGVIVCNIPFKNFEKQKGIIKNKCGDCHKCIDVCPNGALDNPDYLDARKCISYHTIEDKCLYNTHPINYNGQIFGCEACLKVCPMNKDIPSWREFETNADYLLSLTREDWADMDEENFLKRFADSSLMRAGLAKIKNNL
ncbi:MAG: tRNA epoxyqueuosine(34) reductase QueG [Bacteroidales bacterium]|nr:tRNA epoxyqueuosine(34) reductase QueG [Bacteroidales bacterium]MDD4669507.1 tRNA epoxyqueuosine(34) reductase QueG [Bacteroidales bacterium]